MAKSMAERDELLADACHRLEQAHEIYKRHHDKNYQRRCHVGKALSEAPTHGWGTRRGAISAASKQWLGKARIKGLLPLLAGLMLSTFEGIKQ